MRNHWIWMFGMALCLGWGIVGNSVYGAEPVKHSLAELKEIYAAAGLKERNGKPLDDCDQPVQPKTKTTDLNGDGQPEVFVFVESSCYGMAGGQLSLLIKDPSGRWKANLGVPASGFRILSAKNKGYPDIEIGVPGSCFPIWRWNGAKYAVYKRCNR